HHQSAKGRTFMISQHFQVNDLFSFLLQHSQHFTLPTSSLTTDYQKLKRQFVRFNGSLTVGFITAHQLMGLNTGYANKLTEVIRAHSSAPAMHKQLLFLGQ